MPNWYNLHKVIELTDQEIPDWVRKMYPDSKAPYNTPPTGWRKVNPYEITSLFLTTHIPSYISSALIHDLEKSEQYTVMLYFYEDHTGVGVRRRPKLVDMHSAKFKYKNTYYKFGCEHDYEIMSPEESKKLGITNPAPHRFFVLKCKKCQYYYSYEC